MHRIDGPGHSGNTWVEKDPELGIAGTTFTADWQNELQEEVANVIEGAGLTLTKGDDEQLLAAIISLQSGSSNAITNGLFEFWQRTAPLASAFTLIDTADGDVVIPDRWWCLAGGGSAVVQLERKDFANGTIPPGMVGLGQPYRYLEWDQTTGATTTAPKLEQRIENVRTFAGREVTMSIALRVDSGTLQVTPRLRQDFGVGGSPSADVTLTGSAWTVTTSWTQFTYTVTLGTLNGKTLGTSTVPSARSYLAFELVMPTGSTFTLEAANARVDPGGSPRADWPTREEDLARCRRFFEKSSDIDDNTPGTGDAFECGHLEWTASQRLLGNVRYLVEKYGTGTLVTYDTTTFTADTARVGGAEKDVAYVGTAESVRSITVYIDAAETPTNAYEEWSFHWNLDTGDILA